MNKISQIIQSKLSTKN